MLQVHLFAFPKNPFNPIEADLLPDLSNFMHKMKETSDVNKKVKSPLPYLLKFRSFTSSRHSVFLRE